MSIPDPTAPPSDLEPKGKGKGKTKTKTKGKAENSDTNLPKEKTIDQRGKKVARMYEIQPMLSYP